MIEKNTYVTIKEVSGNIKARPWFSWITLRFTSGDSVEISKKWWEELGKPSVGDVVCITLSTKPRQEES